MVQGMLLVEVRQKVIFDKPKDPSFTKHFE